MKVLGIKTEEILHCPLFAIYAPDEHTLLIRHDYSSFFGGAGSDIDLKFYDILNGYHAASKYRELLDEYGVKPRKSKAKKEEFRELVKECREVENQFNADIPENQIDVHPPHK